MIRARLYEYIRNGLVVNEDERWGWSAAIFIPVGGAGSLAGNMEERERKGGCGLRLWVASFP
jgi:hypothetical protein